MCDRQPHAMDEMEGCGMGEWARGMCGREPHAMYEMEGCGTCIGERYVRQGAARNVRNGGVWNVYWGEGCVALGVVLFVEKGL